MTVHFRATETDRERLDRLIAAGMGNDKTEVIRRALKLLEHFSNDDSRIVIHREGEEPVELKVL